MFVAGRAVLTAHGHTGAPPLVEAVCPSLCQLINSTIASGVEEVMGQFRLIRYCPEKFVQLVPEFLRTCFICVTQVLWQNVKEERSSCRKSVFLKGLDSSRSSRVCLSYIAEPTQPLMVLEVNVEVVGSVSSQYFKYINNCILFSVPFLRE